MIHVNDVLVRSWLGKVVIKDWRLAQPRYS